MVQTLGQLLAGTHHVAVDSRYANDFHIGSRQGHQQSCNNRALSITADSGTSSTMSQPHLVRHQRPRHSPPTAFCFELGLQLEQLTTSLLVALGRRHQLITELFEHSVALDAVRLLPFRLKIKQSTVVVKVS